MRQVMDLFETSQKGFEGKVYHGCTGEFSPDHIDPERGCYFSGDYEYARSYGPDVYECDVTLQKPIYFSEEEAQGTMEINRPILMQQGFDGRIVTYDNGEIDVIAFIPEQIHIIGKAAN